MDYTPKYKLVITDQKGVHTQTWKGRATPKRLAEYVSKYIDSLKIGGVNEHLSLDYGFMPIPSKAIIEENRYQGKAVHTWTAPMFMVI